MRANPILRNVLVTAFLTASFCEPAMAELRDAQEQTIKSNDGTSFDMTSGVVRVPEFHVNDEKASGSIDLAVVRVRRSGSSSRTAHLILAGGPGDSGVNLVLGLARQGGSSLADLLDGDIIGFDQRGTGKSVPNLATTVRYDLPIDRPGSPELWLPLMDRACRSVAADFASQGIHLKAYNTRESAEDVNAVRLAFGYEKIVLWGRSYGSHLALATLRQHPDTIEKLVLVSPEGPNHTWKLPARVDAVLQRLSERAKRPEFIAQMREVLAGLERSPAIVTTTHPRTKELVTITLSAFDVRRATAEAMTDPRSLVTLPSAYQKMSTGDFQQVAQVVLLQRGRMGVESTMKHMMDLSSGATAERRARIKEEAETAILGDAMNFPGMYLAKAWGSPDLGDEFRKPVSSPVPTLIIVGDLDARTPVENGEEIAATLQNGRLVVVENATHQFDLFGSEPMRELIARFLTGEPTPDRITMSPLKFPR